MANHNINPFGTNEVMPNGYPIINDLVTGGANKALSAEMGKQLGLQVLPTWEPFDTSAITEVNAYIAINDGSLGANKWKVNFSGYKGKFIPVQAGERYKLISNGQNGKFYYAVLTTNSYSDNQVPSYATGFSETIGVEVGNESEVVIPIDGTYLYFTTLVNGTDRTPIIKVKSGTPPFVSQFIADNFNGGASKALSAERGKELRQMFPSNESITVSAQAIYITVPGGKWAVFNGYKGCLIPAQNGDVFVITAKSDKQCRYCVVKNNNVVDSAAVDFATGYSSALALEAGESVKVSIPEDGHFLYVNTNNVEYGDVAPTVEKVSYGEFGPIIKEIEEAASKESKFPTMLYFGEPTNIIYTIDDFLLAHEYDEGQNINNLKFSTDLGKTWTTIANTFGVITNAFRFADGTFMMCCQQSDGMHFLWSRDFETFNDCVVYDYDGEPYQTRTGDRRCFINRPRYKHLYVDNTEYYLIGDYVFPESNSASANPRLWYAISEDAGVTMRCAFAFGLQQIDGVTIPARHVHNFEYNPYNGYFYAMTGDHGENECNVMRGRHVNHVWTWERLAHGQQYKVMYPVFDEGNIYLTTDYTDSSLVNAKGIVRVPVNRFDFDNFHYLFHATAEFMLEGSIDANQPAAIAQMVIDNHGWRFLITDYIGNSKHLIAKGNHNFVWVDNTTGKKFDGIIGPNSNGDVYVSAKTPSANVPEASLKISHKTTYNLTDAMRNSGATDFFKDFVNSVY